MGGWGGTQEVVMFTEACLYYCIVVSHVTLFATLKGFAHETEIDGSLLGGEAFNKSDMCLSLF